MEIVSNSVNLQGVFILAKLQYLDNIELGSYQMVAIT